MAGLSIRVLPANWGPYDVDIVDAEFIEADCATETGATYYTVCVSHSSGESWRLQKRYAEFEDLKVGLQQLGVSVPSFPRKHLFRSSSDSVIEERKAGLALFLQETVLKYTRLPLISAFLQLTRTPAEPRSERATSVLAPPRPVVVQQQELRAMSAPQLQLPQIQEPQRARSESQQAADGTLNEWRLDYEVNIAERLTEHSKTQRLQRAVDEGQLMPVPDDQWDEDSTECAICQRDFNLFSRRRHHCRVCGRCVCTLCALRRISFSEDGWDWDLGDHRGSQEPEPVCDACVDRGLLGEVTDVLARSTKREASADLVPSEPQVGGPGEAPLEESPASPPPEAYELVSRAKGPGTAVADRREAVLSLVLLMLQHPEARPALVDAGVAEALVAALQRPELRSVTRPVLQAATVLSLEQDGRVAARRAGLAGVLLQRLVAELSQQSGSVAMVSAALEALCADLHVADLLLTQPKLLEALLRYDVDLGARDAGLALLVSVCRQHPSLVPTVAELGVVGWVAPMTGLFVDEFDDDALCASCSEPLCTEGRRFQRVGKHADLCIDCATAVMEAREEEEERQQLWKARQQADDSGDSSEEESEDSEIESDEEDSSGEGSDDEGSSTVDGLFVKDLHRVQREMSGVAAEPRQSPGSRTSEPSALVLELPQDKAAELLASLAGAPVARAHLARHPALPELARLLAQGTPFGISCALDVIRALVTDPTHTSCVYTKCGIGPVALALGVAVEQAAVEEELQRLGLPCQLGEEEEM